jgi:uncharacterized protein YdaU (DUF1376 family)
MNYYEHHLGDYAKDTGHLTMLEHGAYRILLDRYYSTEEGIPAAQAHRLARARSDEERQAVDAVLEEFFNLVDGVWINGRAEEEIARAQVKINAARENGKKGGRPRKSAAETQQKPTGFSSVSVLETQQVDRLSIGHVDEQNKQQEHANGADENNENNEIDKNAASTPQNSTLETQQKPPGLFLGYEIETQQKAHQTPDTISKQQQRAGAREADLDKEKWPPNAQNAMTPDWQPSPVFTTLARNAGLPVHGGEQFDAARAEFVSYWLTRADRRTQHEWDHSFIRSLKNDMVKAQSASPPSSRASPKKSRHSGFENLDYRAGVNPNGSF